MVPGVRLEGMVLDQGLLRDSEIQQCIQEALDELDAIFPVKGHPVIRPDTGFIDLGSTSRPPRCVLLISRFLLSTSWVGVCRDSLAPSAILARRCRRMKLHER
jgi:hypothetical protein